MGRQRPARIQFVVVAATQQQQQRQQQRDHLPDKGLGRRVSEHASNLDQRPGVWGSH